VSFFIANSIYAFARVATIVLSCTVFLYGLRKLEFKFDYATGNFNSPAVQFSAVSIILFFQGYLLYFFISKQIKRARENVVPVVTKTKPKQKLRKREGKSDSLHLFCYFYHDVLWSDIFYYCRGFLFLLFQISIYQSWFYHTFVYNVYVYIYMYFIEIKCMLCVQERNLPCPRTMICRKLIKRQRKIWEIVLRLRQNKKLIKDMGIIHKAD